MVVCFWAFLICDLNFYSVINVLFSVITQFSLLLVIYICSTILLYDHDGSEEFSVFLYFLLFIHLKYRDTDREGEKFSIHWFTSWTRPKPVRSFLQVCFKGAGSQALETSPAFPVTLTGSGIEQQGLKTAPVWDRGISLGGLTCYATTLPLLFWFIISSWNRSQDALELIPSRLLVLHSVFRFWKQKFTASSGSSWLLRLTQNLQAAMVSASLGVKIASPIAFTWKLILGFESQFWHWRLKIRDNNSLRVQQFQYVSVSHRSFCWPTLTPKALIIHLCGSPWARILWLIRLLGFPVPVLVTAPRD